MMVRAPIHEPVAFQDFIVPFEQLEVIFNGIVDWRSYHHPQLGKVELGGWDFLHMWTNVPLEFLEKEISPFPDWVVWHALISPRLTLWETSVTSLSVDSFRVRLVVQNEGWLSTYVSKKALERKVSRGVIAEIQLPKVAQTVQGVLEFIHWDSQGDSGVHQIVAVIILIPDA